MRAIIRQFGLAAGLAEGEDPKQLPPGALSVLENSVWKKIGRVEKRFGTSFQGTAAASAKRLFVRGDELAMTDGASIYSRTAAGWVSRGSIPNVGITTETMIAALSTVRAADSVVVGSSLVEAWILGNQSNEGESQLFYQVTDLSMGVFITAPTLVLRPSSTAASKARDKIRLVTDGVGAWLVWIDSPSSARTCILPILPVAGSTVSLATDAMDVGTSSVAALDAIVVGSEILIGYSKKTGGIALLRVSASGSPAVLGTGTVPGETSLDVGSLSLSGAPGESLFIAWSTIGDVSGTDYVRFACANVTTLAQTLAPVAMFTSTPPYQIQVSTVACARYAASQAILCFHTAVQDVGTPVLSTFVVDNSGATLLTGGTDRTFGVLSRPALIGTRWVVVVANYPGEAGVGYTSGTTLPTSETLLLDVSPGGVDTRPVEQGKIECVIGSFWAVGYFSSVSADGYVATPFANSGAYGVSNMAAKVLTAARRTKLTAGGGADMWRSISIDKEACFAAGTLCSYDGERGYAWGFATGPLLSTLFTSTSTVGGNIAAGTYLYNVTGERRNASGLLHRSPIGVAQSVTTTGATSSNTIGIVASDMDRSSTARQGAYLVYRSTVNGTVLQRIALPPSLMTRVIGSDVYDVTDTQSDASAGLKIKAALYTEGGELEDMQPPSARTLALHQNRIWMVGVDGFTAWFSKDRSVNPGIAPGFHPSMTLTFEETINALASLDDKLAALSEKRVWVVLGNGPGPNGEQSDYTILPVQSDVGCTNPRSVVAVPEGIMFQSDRGLMFLSRGLEVSFVGAPVDDTLAAFPHITSAVLVAHQNQVRWTCNSADGTAGRVIVFDYFTRQWSVFRYRDVTGSVADTPIADACMWQGAWTFVTPLGNVYSESETTNLDSGSWVTMRGATAWMSEGGPLGFAHIRRAFLLGDRDTACGLKLSFGFGHADTYAQSYTWTSAALDAMGDGINVGMHVGSQNGASPRTRAFRVAWEDVAPPVPEDGPSPFGTGHGFNLSAIGIEFVPKPDMDRRSAKART